MIEIIQHCDLCKKSRSLPGSDRRHQEMQGWRQIPIRPDFGIEREEQPWLCPTCQESIWMYVQSRRPF